MFVVMTTAALVMLVLMFVVMTTAALVVVFMVMMVTALALVMLVFMFVVMTTAALVMLVLVFMAVLPFPVGGMLRVPGVDFHFPFHGSGKLHQLRDQGVRVRGGEPQLLGGKGDHCLLHLGMGVELCLDLGRAVGAVQILNYVYLPGHRATSLIQYMSKRSCVYHQYIPIPVLCQGCLIKSFCAGNDRCG